MPFCRLRLGCWEPESLLVKLFAPCRVSLLGRKVLDSCKAEPLTADTACQLAVAWLGAPNCELASIPGSACVGVFVGGVLQ